MDNKKNAALEEQFRRDCKVIEFKYEYPGYTGDIPFGIITALSEKELECKYGKLLNAYRPHVLLDTEYGEIRADFNRNQDKYIKRQNRRGSMFRYGKYGTMSFGIAALKMIWLSVLSFDLPLTH